MSDEETTLRHALERETEHLSTILTFNEIRARARRRTTAYRIGGVAAVAVVTAAAMTIPGLTWRATYFLGGPPTSIPSGTTAGGPLPLRSCDPVCRTGTIRANGREFVFRQTDRGFDFGSRDQRTGLITWDGVVAMTIVDWVRSHPVFGETFYKVDNIIFATAGNLANGAHVTRITAVINGATVDASLATVGYGVVYWFVGVNQPPPPSMTAYDASGAVVDSTSR